MRHFFILFFTWVSFSLAGQSVLVNGYVFEDGNRGYLNQVNINIVDKSTGQNLVDLVTNKEGYFEVDLPANKEFVAFAQKQLFEKNETNFDTKNVEPGSKKFVKIKMNREPGYDFEVTLAPKRESEDIPVDAIRGAWIEVYNNTTKEEVLNLKDHPELEFNVHFDKGNHYTVMIRKEGFFTKRMEAYVNVDGCILCFEGVGSIRPGVVENLTEGNDMGVLLTNVELDPLFSGKTFEVQNIYYDFGRATLRAEAKRALKNLALVLTDNPHILVELGSHTDSRGEQADNQTLSEKRAKSAVDYLVSYLDVSRKSIIAAGYGESRLSNKCSDGVTCTEEEHQENRRTAITVLNINDNNRERKTLKEIRVEEEFLKSVMADDIETKIEEVKSAEEEESNASNEEVEAEETEEKEEAEETENNSAIEAKEENEIEVIEKEMTISDNANESTVVSQEIKKTKAISSQGKLAKRPKNQSKTISKEKMRAMKAKKKVEQQKVQEKEMHNTHSSSSGSNSDTSFLLDDYTGHKIVVQFSRYPLGKEHKVFETHTDIIEYKATSGSYLYLIGDFDTEEKATEFLNNTVLMMYPGAYTVRFENGRRMK